MISAGHAELRDQLRRSCEELGTAPSDSEIVSLLISHLRSAGGDMLMRAGELTALQRMARRVSTADTALIKTHLRALTELVGEFERECGHE